MPKKSTYAQGTPNWVDLQTTDTLAAKQFYASLFGWRYQDNALPDGDAYSMAAVDGQLVAAIGPQPPGTPAGMPPLWKTYLAVDDVDAAVDRVAPAGGNVLAGPVDVGDAGRMAFIADPTGAVVLLWLAYTHVGATLVGEPGAVLWNELITDDPDSAVAFYEAVVGLTHTSVEVSPGQTYRLLQVGGTDVAGCTVPPTPEVPSHWHVYFAVADVEATVAKTTAGGGRVMVEPFDIPQVGRCAILSDPQGGVFSVLKPV